MGRLEGSYQCEPNILPSYLADGTVNKCSMPSFDVLAFT